MDMNHDELVEHCLTFFKEDEESSFESVEAFVKANTSLKAKSLENEVLKICHECSDMVKKEKAKEARQPPTPAPPSIRVEPPQTEEPSYSAMPNISGLSVSNPPMPATSTTSQSAPGPSTTPKPPITATTTTAPRSTFAWNLNAPHFVPTRPARKAMYQQRIATVNANITRMDSKIQVHKSIIQYGRSAMSDPSIGNLPDMITKHVMDQGLDPAQGEGKKLMDWVSENEKNVGNIEKVIKEHESELQKAMAQKEDLFGELFPRDWELGPNE